MSTYLSIDNYIYVSDHPLNDNDIQVSDCPSPYHLFDYDNKEWYIDIDLLKEVKLAEIYEEFEYRLNENVGYYSQTINKVINSRRADLDNMYKLLDEMENKGIKTTLFRCYDDDYVTITIDQLKQMIQELIDFGLYLYHKKWQYENQILNETNIDILINIKWED